MSASFHTPAALVGLGAPIHIFLPDVAKALGAKCVIPERASVANALGAIIGNVVAVCEILIKPQYSLDGIEGYIVFGKSQNSVVVDRDEAIAIGQRQAEEGAQEEARRRGASGDLAVTSEVVTKAAPSKSGTEVLIEINVTARAIGGAGL